MGRKLRTDEIRRKRAEARADTRGHRIGTEVACRVPCAHGHERGCLVYFVARLDGAMLHVSSDCTRKPPPPAEVAVMQGLLGESKYHICSDVVNGVKQVMTSLDDWQARRHAMQSLPISDASHPVLWHAIEAAREIAIERHGTGDSPDADPAKTMRRDLRQKSFDRLTRGVPLPAGWRIGLTVRERSILVKMRSHTWGGDHRVAAYVRGGSFALLSEGLHYLAHDYDSGVSRDYEGKKPCAVCGKRITSPSAHVKTNRHQANVEAAVLDAIEVIGQRLAPRDWRLLTQPAQPAII
jgi:hypothetical protein